MKYTKKQYEKFFDNFEYCNAGIVYKPRTFCSQRLEALHNIILEAFDEEEINEEKIKEAIISNQKLGVQVIHLMYGDEIILKTLDNDSDKLPDFADAINRWRRRLKV